MMHLFPVNFMTGLMQWLMLPPVKEETSGCRFFSFVFPHPIIQLINISNGQPTHPGTMAQIGLNAGPRHCRVSGFAVSFCKKLDKGTMISRDVDAIGAVSVSWALVCALMPSDVVSHVEECLRHEGLPRLATRNVEEGRILIIYPLFSVLT